jgi:methionyl aminopeptidase
LTALSKAEVDAFREAGRISARARDWGAAAVKAGALARHVQEGIEEVIRNEGALPSFPAQTSINHVAAHYCSSPGDPTAFADGDLVKVDVGAHVDGYPADTGVTVDLSPDGRWTDLIGAAVAALDAAISLLKGGTTTRSIGVAVERTIRKAGFRPIANLTGHGLARWSLHAPPQIPNVGELGGEVLKSGMVFAIEPFATTGSGFVVDEGRAQVFAQTGELPNAGACDGALLDAIRAWHGLPIARRYFLDHPKNPFERCLRDLVKRSALHAYPPLVEASGAPVAWKEHSIYLSEHGPEVLTA